MWQLEGSGVESELVQGVGPGWTFGLCVCRVWCHAPPTVACHQAVTAGGDQTLSCRHHRWQGVVLHHSPCTLEGDALWWCHSHLCGAWLSVCCQPWGS